MTNVFDKKLQIIVFSFLLRSTSFQNRLKVDKKFRSITKAGEMKPCCQWNKFDPRIAKKLPKKNILWHEFQKKLPKKLSVSLVSRYEKTLPHQFWRKLKNQFSAFFLVLLFQFRELISLQRGSFISWRDLWQKFSCALFFLIAAIATYQRTKNKSVYFNGFKVLLWIDLWSFLVPSK